jgi:predicted RecA/RadA family phage recombinase
MAKNFVQPGRQLTLVAPTGGVTTGIGVLIGVTFAVALQTVAAGGNFDGATSGVWDLAKLNTEVWAAGDKIYWDNANARATNAPASGVRLIGYATLAAANPSTTGRVRLSGGVASVDDDATPAPRSYATVGAQVYTAADILGGIIVRDTNGASRTDTLPTAALLVAAIPGVRVGDVVRCQVINGADAAEVLTIAVGAGGAYDANQTAASQVIGQNGSKTLAIRFTNVTAAAEAYVAYL